MCFPPDPTQNATHPPTTPEKFYLQALISPRSYPKRHPPSHNPVKRSTYRCFPVHPPSHNRWKVLPTGVFPFTHPPTTGEKFYLQVFSRSPTLPQPVKSSTYRCFPVHPPSHNRWKVLPTGVFPFTHPPTTREKFYLQVFSRSPTLPQPVKSSTYRCFPVLVDGGGGRGLDVGHRLLAQRRGGRRRRRLAVGLGHAAGPGPGRWGRGPLGPTAVVDGALGPQAGFLGQGRGHAGASPSQGPVVRRHPRLLRLLLAKTGAEQPGPFGHGGGFVREGWGWPSPSRTRRRRRLGHQGAMCSSCRGGGRRARTPTWQSTAHSVVTLG